MINFEYPLQWAPQQPRTENPERARFGNHSVYTAGEKLMGELFLMGAINVVISSNLRTKKDGSFYAQQSRIDDPGVVVYFQYKNKDKAMACDKWDLPEHNLWALALSIGAIRGLERWGGSEFLDGLFTGFAALPAPGETVVSVPRYFDHLVTPSAVASEFRSLALTLHPDRGGDPKIFAEMKKQYDQKVEQLKGGDRNA